MALTARFGYTYALDPRTTAIREAISGKKDSADLLFYFKVLPELRNSIMIDEQNGRAMIALGSEGVIVPWPSLPVSGFTERAMITNFKAAICAFPTRFSADLDFSSFHGES